MLKIILAGSYVHEYLRANTPRFHYLPYFFVVVVVVVVAFLILINLRDLLSGPYSEFLAILNS